MLTRPLSVNLRFEDKSILGLALERHSQLEQLDGGIGELFEEHIIVLGVSLDVLQEFRVFDECHIGRQHHQSLGGFVFILLGSTPALPTPFLL